MPHMGWPTHGDSRKSQPHTEDFLDNLMKTLSHRVSNRSKRKIQRCGHRRKKCLGEDCWSAGVDKVVSRGEAVPGVGSLSTQVEAGAGGEPDPHTHAALGTREPRGAVNKVFALFHPGLAGGPRNTMKKAGLEAWKEEPEGLRLSQSGGVETCSGYYDRKPFWLEIRENGKWSGS